MSSSAISNNKLHAMVKVDADDTTPAILVALGCGLLVRNDPGDYDITLEAPLDPARAVLDATLNEASSGIPIAATISADGTTINVLTSESDLDFSLGVFDTTHTNP